MTEESTKWRGMTVAELRKALEGAPDDMVITVLGENADGDSLCGALFRAEVDRGCDDAPHFVLEATEDEDLIAELAEVE